MLHGLISLDLKLAVIEALNLVPTLHWRAAEGDVTP